MSQSDTRHESQWLTQTISEKTINNTPALAGKKEVAQIKKSWSLLVLLLFLVEARWPGMLEIVHRQSNPIPWRSCTLKSNGGRGANRLDAGQRENPKIPQKAHSRGRKQMQTPWVPGQENAGLAGRCTVIFGRGNISWSFILVLMKEIQGGPPWAKKYITFWHLLTLTSSLALPWLQPVL